MATQNNDSISTRCGVIHFREAETGKWNFQASLQYSKTLSEKKRLYFQVIIEEK
jgi:hypothetical protein